MFVPLNQPAFLLVALNMAAEYFQNDLLSMILKNNHIYLSDGIVWLRRLFPGLQLLDLTGNKVTFFSFVFVFLTSKTQSFYFSWPVYTFWKVLLATISRSSDWQGIHYALHTNIRKISNGCIIQINTHWHLIFIIIYCCFRCIKDFFPSLKILVSIVFCKHCIISTYRNMF